MQDKQGNLEVIKQGPEKGPEKANEEKQKYKIEKSETLKQIIEKGEEAGLEQGFETGEISEKKEKFRESFFTTFVKSIFSGGQSQKKKGAFPPPVKMKKEVEMKLKHEIKVVKKQIKKVMRKKQMKAYELNELVKKLRQLSDLLKSLAHSTIDTITKLWIKYVRNKGVN